MADEASDDLRSLLSKSFDDAQASTALSSGTVEPPDPKADAAFEADTRVDDKVVDTDRARDASGKFTKKDGTDAEPKADAKADAETGKKAAAEPDADKKPEADDGKEKPESKPEDPNEKAIARWSASDKAMFRLQTPEAQAFLIRRNNALEAKSHKDNEANASLRREYEPIQQMFAPHLEVLKQKGLSPASVIQRWGDVETRLASGDPEKQIQIIAGIIQGYNIDKAMVGRALGFTSNQQAQAGTEIAGTNLQDQALPPALANELAQLRATVDSIKANHQTAEQRALEAQRLANTQRENEADSKIQTFKSATDKEGQLLHPYFDEVEQTMVALATSLKAMGQPIPELDALYDQAVYANPSTRQALLATQKVAQEAKAAEEARAKAASARRAASSVTGAPGSGQATRPVRSERTLREELDENFDAIASG